MLFLIAEIPRKVVDCRALIRFRKMAGDGVGCVSRRMCMAKSTKTAGKNKFDWFTKARFGMFVHWGLYAVPAGEWKGRKDYGEWLQFSANIHGEEYEKLAKKFTAAKFDADKWAGLASDAGMKYLVVTTKHHDGFCLFDTRHTDFNIVKASPYGRDPLRDLARACRKNGIMFCVYYSVKDWHHPEYPTSSTWRTKAHPDGFHGFPNPAADYVKYLDYMQAQLRELLTNYGPVGIIWFDWGPIPEGARYMKKAREIERMIHRLQPACLINPRFGGIEGDYGTPEQEIPKGALPKPFEVCMTLNDHWGFNKYDHNWKTAATVVRNLVDVVNKGGNYLLNVGPTEEGVIPAESMKILRQVGKWLKTNGESIYGAVASPIPTRWIEDIKAITVKPGRYYLHVFDWPKDRKLFLHDFTNKRLVTAYLLADRKRKPLAADIYPQSLMLHLPASAPDPIDSVVVVEWKGR
ncbi:MAG: alpha-L-fucosidase [Verrucomicrobia bacterium]|nr:alpha-L-fucosidase [Verrucomicrobiota bacterium]